MGEPSMGSQALAEDERAELEELRAAKAAHGSSEPQEAIPAGMDPELYAELKTLREERKAREAAEQEAEEKAERERPANSHYLHLANGDIIESAGVMTHYGPNAIPVIAVAPIEDRSGEQKAEEGQ